MDELHRLLKSEDNLLTFRPHIKSYKLPDNQVVADVADKYIVTAPNPGEEYLMGSDGLYTLLTLWEIDGKELKDKAVKVDFKPQREEGASVVDIKDDVIICVESVQEGHNTRYQIRVFHLFNEIEIAQPRESDEIIKNTRDMGLNNCPRVMIGREGLLIVHTTHDIKWTRWTEGKGAIWGHIEKHPYLGFSSHIGIYGHDIVAILGPAAPHQPSSGTSGYGGFPVEPIEREYLLLYKLDDTTRPHTMTRAQMVLRMPHGRNEFPPEGRDLIPHGIVNETINPGRLTDSSNGRSQIIEVAFTIFDEHPIPTHMVEDSVPWIIVNIPVKYVREAVLSGIFPSRILPRNGLPPIHQNRRNPLRICRMKYKFPDLNNDEEYALRLCDCCVQSDKSEEIFRDLKVVSPDMWKEGSSITYLKGPENTHQDLRVFGTRHISYYRHYNEQKNTKGTILTELYIENHRTETGYVPACHRSLGGLGGQIDVVVDRAQNVRSAVSEQPYICGHPYLHWDKSTPFTSYGGCFEDVPAHGLVTKVIFDGEKVVFEHETGWVTIFDFA
nr:uncharacterized protein I206_03878 [Kwoniella pini CBS 10737]OCF50553.1 hypothetical protein I206_03878 [Kwoniella pini CBS 10737]